jgi:hypothetical protein
MPATTKYFRAPLLTQGVVNWDYYYLGTAAGNGTMEALYSDPNYPNAPQTNRTASAFNAGLITGDDLGNTLGALGANYGASLSGWITPTNTDTYTFYIASDDRSDLWLSTDANPANATIVAQETACCNPFQDSRSYSVNLTQNTPYYIRASYSEGGGGDYVRVAWKSSSDTNAPASLQPIPGVFLSSYAPVPAPVFSAPVLSGGTLTIAWTAYQGTLEQSTDLINWTPVPGNPNPLIVPNVNTAGPMKFYRVAQ